MEEKNSQAYRRTTWRSLTVQLLAVVVFPLIGLLLGVTFWSTSMHENAMRDLVGDRDERSARMAANVIQDQLQQRVDALHATAALVNSGQAADLPATPPGFTGNLALLDRDGRITPAQNDAKRWSDWQAQTAQALAALRADPALGAVLASEGQVLVIAATGDKKAFLAGLVDLTRLVERVFSGVYFNGQGVSIALISADGRPLYRQGFAESGSDFSQPVGAAEALAGRQGKAYIKVNGSEQVMAYSPVDAFGWALLIREPWEQAASPLLQTTHLAPLVLVPVLLLALLAIFFGIRQIVQPLQALAVQAGQLSWGDASAIERPVGGVSEIRRLQQELIHMTGKLRAAQDSLHDYIGAITSGQEEERRRLAHELHDDTIQSLIALKQRVQLLAMDHDKQPFAKDLANLESLTEQTIENIRRIISALRPIYLEDLGLAAAIHMLANETGKQLGAPVEYSITGIERRLTAPVELALYRVVQEALNNAARHSGASQVTVILIYQAGSLQIEVSDNGRGFKVPDSPAAFAPGGHFGLLGLFERAELIGAKITIDSQVGKGTRLTIKV